MFETSTVCVRTILPGPLVVHTMRSLSGSMCKYVISSTGGDANIVQ